MQVGMAAADLRTLFLKRGLQTLPSASLVSD